MKNFQALWSPAIPLASFHDLLLLLISSSIVLRYILFGLPLLLYPWVFQSNAVFSIAPVSLRNVHPIQFHFLLFIWFSIDFWWVILHSSSFIIKFYSNIQQLSLHKGHLKVVKPYVEGNLIFNFNFIYFILRDWGIKISIICLLVLLQGEQIQLLFIIQYLGITLFGMMTECHWVCHSSFVTDKFFKNT